MSRYDENILKCIEKSFKTADTITLETGISKSRVIARLSHLRKLKEVIWIHEIRDQKQGIRPKKYRKAPQLS